jgi:FAD dependent oxidoreductase TIGR03364
LGDTRIASFAKEIADKMSSEKFDLIVIGAGVLGTFHTYHASLIGKKVLHIEKDQYPQHATVRNFGQVVPSGMPADWFDYSLYSTQLYNTIQKEYDISIRNNGSIYVASDEEEQQLIHELKSIMDERHYKAHLLTQEQCLTKWPALKASYCREGLFFPQELSAEPSIMIHRLLEYCTIKFPDLVYKPATTIIDCQLSGDEIHVITHTREKFVADKVILCNGGEFKILFPELFRTSGIEISKLQMLRTIPLPEVGLEGNILTGLTIRRYESFSECPSYSSIHTPEHLRELKRWGIHILFKKAIDGSIIIGDSHEYAGVADMDDLGFELKQHINQLMFQEAQKIVSFDVSAIASSWAGFYAQHPEKDIVEIDLEDKIHIRTAIGGKGMTSSAGYAQKSIQKLFATHSVY